MEPSIYSFSLCTALPLMLFFGFYFLCVVIKVLIFVNYMRCVVKLKVEIDKFARKSI